MDDIILSVGYNIAGPHVVLPPGHEGDVGMVRILQEHVKQVIAPFKYPRRVIFAKALPNTATGKLQREGAGA